MGLLARFAQPLQVDQVLMKSLLGRLGEQRTDDLATALSRSQNTSNTR